MIWTMFLAMAVSVSGLRKFLDPASAMYRPELGWVAGSLAWVNNLVVPLSIFANGAWVSVRGQGEGWGRDMGTRHGLYVVADRVGYGEEGVRSGAPYDVRWCAARSACLRLRPNGIHGTCLGRRDDMPVCMLQLR